MTNLKAAKPYQHEIDKAIAELTGLRNRRICTSARSRDDELASYEDAKQMALEAHEICAALLIGLSEIASDCAGIDIGKPIRDAFRDTHLVQDALYSADEWAEDYARDTEAA